MRHYLSIRIVVFCLAMLSAMVLPMGAYGQLNGFDCGRLFEPDIDGTARYVAMGGAMAAVGGDISAAQDNPAGLGLYRRSELLASIGMRGKRTAADGNRMLSLSATPQIAWLFNFTKPNVRRGVVSNSLLLSFRRQCNYAGEWMGRINGLSSSQSDLMADQSYGLRYEDLAATNAYDNTDVGWLSKAGFDAFMTDVTEPGGKQWTSLEPGRVDASLKITEDGALDAYGISWGMNVSNRFYVGLGANIMSLTYDKISSYHERFESRNQYTLESNLLVSGLGADFSFGLIYRPISSFRMAASVASPMFMSLRSTCYGNINATILDTLGHATPYGSVSPSYNETSSVKSPLRVTAGLAYSFGQKALLSAQYDYRHALMECETSTHDLRLGGELVLAHNWFLNAGYALRLYDWVKDSDGEGQVFLPGINSARLDTDTRVWQGRHHASLGLQYRNHFMTLGLAYQYAYQGANVYAHAYQDKPYFVVEQSHRVVLTAAWRY